MYGYTWEMGEMGARTRAVLWGRIYTDQSTTDVCVCVCRPKIHTQREEEIVAHAHAKEGLHCNTEITHHI